MSADVMGFDSGGALTVDGVTYTFPVGGATMMVGDSGVKSPRLPFV